MIEHDRVAPEADSGRRLLDRRALTARERAHAFEPFEDGTAGLAYVLEDRVGDLDGLPRAVEAVSAGRG